MPIAENTFARVLANHMYTRPASWTVKGALITCECGDTIFAPIGGTSPSEAIAQHLAEKLEQAGFSPIPEPAFDEKEPDLGPCPHPGKCASASVCWGCG